jgi:hypothetical protein
MTRRKKNVAKILRGGLICAVLGPAIAGFTLYVLITAWRYGISPADTTSFWHHCLLMLAYIAYAGLFSAPFGFLSGIAGTWWLVRKAESAISNRQLKFEAVRAGAILGAMWPFLIELYVEVATKNVPIAATRHRDVGMLRTLLGWAALGAWSGILCGFVLAWWVQNKIPSRETLINL